MEKWKLNIELLKNIFEVCDQPIQRVLKKLDISYSTWMTWMSVETGKKESSTPEQGGVLVTAMIAVCNELRVPVRKLFYKEGEVAVIPARQDIECRKRRFISCRFDKESFHASFGLRSKDKKSVKRMMGELGYSYHVYAFWVRKDSALRVAQLIRFCEVFGYDLFSFLVDKNKESVNEPKEKPSVMTDAEEKEKMQMDIASLRERNSKLSRQFKEKCKEAEGLSKEVSELKVKNMELEYEVVRLKRHIETIELGSHGMVAENDFPEWEKGTSKEKLV